MTNTHLHVRTVSMQELKVTNTGDGRQTKSIMFRIANDRPYRRPVVENGKTVMKNPTNYWTAKAYGETAQALSDYCSQKKEDGKIVSRRLLLAGNFEQYTETKTVKRKGIAKNVVIPNVNVGGALYNVSGNDIEVEVEVEQDFDNTIFVVDSFEFLDYKPVNQEKSAEPVAVVASATPVATPAQPAQVASPAPATPVPANVQPSPAMTEAVAAMETIAQQAVAGTPVVAPNFVPTGETAPF